MLNSITNATNSFVKTTSSNVSSTTASLLNSADEILAAAAAESEVTNTDTFEVSGETNSAGIYSPSDLPTSSNATDVDINALKAESYDNFSNMLSQMLGEQVEKSTTASDFYSDISARAEAAISEGGAWSPESVAENILDMAKALSGGDPDTFETLKEAIQKGFEAAEDAWGGELPSITNDTYDLVMKGLDAWEKELFGDVEAEAETETGTEV